MRLQPKNAVVVVHTRWHEEDLSGHLLDPQTHGNKPERWHVIELPHALPKRKRIAPTYHG